jgi:Putative zinc-finger
MSDALHVQRDLSLLADGQLDAAREAAIRGHLATCPTCSGVLDDLLRLRATAQTLGPVDPPDHVWLEIAGRIRLPDRETARAELQAPRRGVRPVAQWIGLSAALLAVTTVLYVLGGRPDAPSVTDTPPVALAPGSDSGTTGPADADELTTAVRPYEQAIAQLEAVASPGTSGIDPALAAALAAEGDAIDRAIAESRTAVEASPENEPARLSLFEALRRKINVLQSTVELINEMNQGDAAGAARAAEGLGRQS